MLIYIAIMLYVIFYANFCWESYVVTYIIVIYVVFTTKFSEIISVS